MWEPVSRDPWGVRGRRFPNLTRCVERLRITGLARIVFLDIGFDVYRSVDDVLHWPQRDCRTASRVTF